MTKPTGLAEYTDDELRAELESRMDVAQGSDFDKELDRILDEDRPPSEVGIKELIKQAVAKHIIGEDEQYDYDKSASALKMNQRKALWGKGEEHGR